MFPVDRMLLYILDLITFSSFVSFLGNFALGSQFSISGPLLKPLQGNSMDSKQHPIYREHACKYCSSVLHSSYVIHLKSIVVEGVDRCLVSLDVPDYDLKQKLNSRGFRDSLRRKSMYFPQISPAYLHL